MKPIGRQHIRTLDFITKALQDARTDASSEVDGSMIYEHEHNLRDIYGLVTKDIEQQELGTVLSRVIRKSV